EKSCYKVPGDPWSELPPENKTIALEYDEMKRRFGPENAKKFLISELLQPFDAQFDQTKIGENRWVIASFHNRVTMVDKTAKYLENYLVNRGPDYDIARRIQSFFEYPALISEIPQIWKYPRGELILIGEGKDLTYLQTLYVNLFHAIRSGENKKLEELLEDLYLKS
ncbi:MAG: hypothetical protein U9M97_04280, partial [Candidatus Hadarchaeota archaeon]|nr:hypothetical protein [Candidatus Hadarchaeota archaeon]